MKIKLSSKYRFGRIAFVTKKSETLIEDLVFYHIFPLGSTRAMCNCISEKLCTPYAMYIEESELDSDLVCIWCLKKFEEYRLHKEDSSRGIKKYYKYISDYFIKR
jgi:hypothetical protein